MLVNQAQDEFSGTEISRGNEVRTLARDLSQRVLAGWCEPKGSPGGGEEGSSVGDQQPRALSRTLVWLAAVTAWEQDSNPHTTGILALF